MDLFEQPQSNPINEVPLAVSSVAELIGTMSKPHAPDFFSLRTGNYVYYRTIGGEIKRDFLRQPNYTSKVVYVDEETGKETLVPHCNSKEDFEKVWTIFGMEKFS